jgi:hypothetical protein
MKVLSVRAPWWWFILHGGKDIENRDWPTSFRGRVLIHAGKWWNQSEIEFAAATARSFMFAEGRRPAWVPDDTFDDLRKSCGCVVGSVRIVDCVSDSRSPWFFGRYGFVLRDPIAFASPVAMKGALKFFEPDAAAVSAISEQILALQFKGE